MNVKFAWLYKRRNLARLVSFDLVSFVLLILLNFFELSVVFYFPLQGMFQARSQGGGEGIEGMILLSLLIGFLISGCGLGGYFFVFGRLEFEYDRLRLRHYYQLIGDAREVAKEFVLSRLMLLPFIFLTGSILGNVFASVAAIYYYQVSLSELTKIGLIGMGLSCIFVNLIFVLVIIFIIRGQLVRKIRRLIG